MYIQLCFKIGQGQQQASEFVPTSHAKPRLAMSWHSLPKPAPGTRTEGGFNSCPKRSCTAPLFIYTALLSLAGDLRHSVHGMPECVCFGDGCTYKAIDHVRGAIIIPENGQRACSGFCRMTPHAQLLPQLTSRGPGSSRHTCRRLHGQRSILFLLHAHAS